MAGNPIPPPKTNTSHRGTFRLLSRRDRLVELMGQNPQATNSQLARMMGVSAATINRDLKAITEELQFSQSEKYMAHYDRVLREITRQKNYCLDRMEKLKGQPHQGARWQEEWGKLVEKEIKILGLNAPEKFAISKDETFSKEERDKAVHQAMKRAGGQVENNLKLIEN